MESRGAVGRAVEALYAAALEPDGWPQALRRISKCLQTRAACVFLIDRPTGQVIQWTGVGLDYGQDDYRRHYVTIDPRRRYAEANPQTRIHYDYMLTDERRMDRDEFYSWQQGHPDRLRYFIGCHVPIDEMRSGFAAFHWPRRHGHAQRHDVRLFKRIVPHIEHALRISDRLARAEQTAAALFDRSVQPIALLDGGGRVASLNAMAERLLGAGDGVSIADRRLCAHLSEEDAELVRLTLRAAAGGVGGMIAVSRPSGRRPYVVLVAPLAREQASFGAGACSALVLIGDPEQERQIPHDMLRRLYGLTPAEAKFAMHLIAGRTIKQAAGELGIAHNTARLHAQRVMHKTRTHRQTDLIRLVLNSTPTLQPHHLD